MSLIRISDPNFKYTLLGKVLFGLCVNYVQNKSRII